MMDGLNLQSQSADAAASLTERFRSGDDAAFDDVVRLYGPDVRHLVRRLTGADNACDDLVQDVFVAALANRGKFRADAALKTWLFAIAVNRCRSYRRRQTVRRLLFRQFAEGYVGPGNSGSAAENGDNIQRALRQLPGKYRDVLVLKYLQEVPTPDMIRILNIRESTLYTRLNRARQYLREKLLTLENQS